MSLWWYIFRPFSCICGWQSAPRHKIIHLLGNLLHIHVPAHIEVEQAVVVIVGSKINVADLLDFGLFVVLKPVRSWG